MPPNNTTTSPSDVQLPSSLRLPSFEALGNARLWFGLFEFHMARENIFDETMLFSFVKQYFPADLTLAKSKSAHSPTMKMKMKREEKKGKKKMLMMKAEQGDEEKLGGKDEDKSSSGEPDSMDIESSTSSSSSSSPTTTTPADQVIDWLELGKHSTPYTHFKQVMLAHYRSDQHKPKGVGAKVAGKARPKGKRPRRRPRGPKEADEKVAEADDQDGKDQDDATAENTKPLQVTPPELELSDSLLDNFTGFTIDQKLSGEETMAD